MPYSETATQFRSADRDEEGRGEGEGRDKQGRGKEEGREGREGRGGERSRKEESEVGIRRRRKKEEEGGRRRKKEGKIRNKMMETRAIPYNPVEHVIPNKASFTFVVNPEVRKYQKRGAKKTGLASEKISERSVQYFAFFLPLLPLSSVFLSSSLFSSSLLESPRVSSPRVSSSLFSSPPSSSLFPLFLPSLFSPLPSLPCLYPSSLTLPLSSLPLSSLFPPSSKRAQQDHSQKIYRSLQNRSCEGELGHRFLQIIERSH
jgi:hypothetical protein